ncbi:PREDICTED: LOW QUALITY PROTEIN: cdc42 effector protein 5 [Dipodomys ordii]|uniref:LOW QUALITY PROTEIN: cdc42 effector protein 5 n=1 Tax=Dipodomys ordii TaxID=10020 RepID=A0A1S3G2Q7_DIPOR|nr:PREDICTED: LOW QUALITY PROTEIN: cdc42 effector protein 5 [Dipodomys ordii]
MAPPPPTPQLPVLKQPGPAQPRKRGAPSISAPLGDFWHTLHVGRGGNALGDTTFLSRHGGAPPPAPAFPSAARARRPTAVLTPGPGPSMLDAVLGVMDAERAQAPGQAAGERAGELRRASGTSFRGVVRRGGFEPETCEGKEVAAASPAWERSPA